MPSRPGLELALELTYGDGLEGVGAVAQAVAGPALVRPVALQGPNGQQPLDSRLVEGLLAQDLRAEGLLDQHSGALTPVRVAPTPHPSHVGLRVARGLADQGSGAVDEAPRDPDLWWVQKGEFKGQDTLASGVSGQEGVAAGFGGLQARQGEGGGVSVRVLAGFKTELRLLVREGSLVGPVETLQARVGLHLDFEVELLSHCYLLAEALLGGQGQVGPLYHPEDHGGGVRAPGIGGHAGVVACPLEPPESL